MLQPSFGTIVKERRQTIGLTQTELARRVGCAAITIRKIEADALRPSVQIAERLALALNIPEAEQLAFVRLARSERPVSPIPPPPPAPEEIGRADLKGRAVRGYQLGERIGSGGFGVVYRGLQTSVEREVAIKLILPHYADHPVFIRRFEAEAQLVARLEHPHIVPLYDYWREPGAAYLVMRLLRGGSLETLLADGPLPPHLLLPMFDQIGAALQAAHQADVVHRDIKPANILLDDNHNAYLADFGIAKDVGLGEPTQGGAVVGSPAYFSPEQIQAEPVKPQSDIYCLGIMLYELLTGHKPFPGPSPLAYIQQHLGEPLPPLATYRSDLPAGLDAALARATAKDPADRYPDVLTFLADFRQAIAEEQRNRGAEVTFSPLPLRTPAPLLELTNPYKGLRPFAEADADDFFGRDTLIQTLLTRLADDDDLARFLAVVGPSGSGKSSAVRAGLLPALRRGGLPGSEQWFITELVPGPQPMEELEAALLRVAINPPASLLAQLQADSRGLLRAVQRILPADPAVELLLVIDQFEELFTLVESEATRSHFIDSLVTALLDERSRLRLVITLRADFLDRPLQYVDLGDLLRQRTEFVLPLGPDELAEAILRPAARRGLLLEPGLAAEIVRDVGDQPGALPLLQYALTELFERREGRQLTRAAYQASGGVLGALARRAEEIFTGLDHAGQAAARQLFLRLVTPGEGVEDTRRRVLKAELAGILPPSNSHPQGEEIAASPLVGGIEEGQLLEAVITVFGRYRLLTFDHDLSSRAPTVEVAHEALLREWGRLRQWLADSRADLRQQRTLAAAAAEWQAAGQEASYLLHGTRLAQLAEWAALTQLALTVDERAFLEASLAEDEARRAAEEARRRRELETARQLAATQQARAEEQGRAARRLRWLSVGLAVLLVAAGLAAVLAWQQTQRAERETRIAIARELAAAAASNLALDPERSILLALQAIAATYSVDQFVLREAEESLHQAVQAARVRLTLAGHSDQVQGVAYSPDGTRLATASQDGTAKVWDSRTGQELLTLAGHPGGINGVAFSPDGARLATTGRDGVTKIWSITTALDAGASSGEEIVTLPATGDAFVSGVAFSPDGTRLATMNEAGLIQVWQLPAGDDQAAEVALTIATGHTGEVIVPKIELAFSPDGTRLASGGPDGTAKVWDANTGQELLTLTGHIDWVFDAAFSPDGKWLATVGIDGTANVWDIIPGPGAGKNLLTLSGPSGEGWSVAFSPDGSRLVTAGNAGVARMWQLEVDDHGELAAGRELMTLAGHAGPIREVVFSPDGAQVATASADGTAKVWDLSPSREWLTLDSDIGFAVGVAYSPNGRQVAAAFADGTVRVWDLAAGAEAAVAWPAHDDWIGSLAFSPDGAYLATGSDDGTARVWDVGSGQLWLDLAGHSGWVNGVAFSPDGRYLATASADRTAKIWDISTALDASISTRLDPDISMPLDTGAAAGQVLLTLAHDETVWGVAFSPDGHWLATATGDPPQPGTVQLWDISTALNTGVAGQPRFSLTGHTNAVAGVAFSPDSRRLASTGFDGTPRVWAVESGEKLLTLTGHTGPVFGVAFSPDGSRLATASEDGTLKVWEATSGELLLNLVSSEKGVGGVAFSPDGTYLAVAGNDGLVRLYVLPLADLMALARARLTRGWTAAECWQFLHHGACPPDF